MADQSILVRALVSKAKTNGRPWLEKLRDDALAAVLAGDVEMTTVAFEGATATGARAFKSQDILDATQLALEEFDDESRQGMIIPCLGGFPR